MSSSYGEEGRCQVAMGRCQVVMGRRGGVK